MLAKLRVVIPAILCVSVLTLSGCGSKKGADSEMGANKDAMGQEESLESKSLGIMEGRTTGPMLPVYYDFDSSDIRDDQVERIEVNGKYLNDNADIKIRVEGNCDPRGTNEYNMALGERRALSAKKYLTNLGVAEARLTTISYGEEKILLHGHDELSWAQNRRSDFVVE